MTIIVYNDGVEDYSKFKPIRKYFFIQTVSYLIGFFCNLFVFPMFIAFSLAGITIIQTKMQTKPRSSLGTIIFIHLLNSVLGWYLNMAIEPTGSRLILTIWILAVIIVFSEFRIHFLLNLQQPNTKVMPSRNKTKAFKKREMKRKKNQEKNIGLLIKLFDIADSIKLSDIISLTGLKESDLKNLIEENAENLSGISFNGQTLIIKSKDDIGQFINLLDSQFQTWEKSEK